jgi:hypothetical protein
MLGQHSSQVVVRAYFLAVGLDDHIAGLNPFSRTAGDQTFYQQPGAHLLGIDTKPWPNPESKGKHFPAGLGIPQLRCTVQTSCSQNPPFWAIGHAIDRFGMAGQGELYMRCLYGPMKHLFPFGGYALV